MRILVGDTGKRLPVDAYCPEHRLVIEYHERQHFVAVPFFDQRPTASGVPRGLQRAMCEKRRKAILPLQGLNLVEFICTDFACRGRHCFLRNRSEDLLVICRKLRPHVAQRPV